MENVNFFKKLWWSITKPSKYEEMSKLGLIKAIKYFIGLVAIMALVLSLLGTCLQKNEIKKISKYLEENLPKFKIENTSKEEKKAKYKLNLDENDVIILDNQDFVNILKNIIVVNVNIKEKDAIEEYHILATNQNNCIILLKSKCIIISSTYTQDKNQGITKYTYEELLNKYFGNNIPEINKEYVMQIFNNVPVLYYIIKSFIQYFIALIVLFTIDIIVLGLSNIIIFKLYKIDITKKKIFSISIYSSTLPIIIYIFYLVINYFAQFNFKYINMFHIIIAYIYIMIYKNKYKKDKKNKNTEEEII